MFKKKLIIAVLIIGIVGAFVAYKMYNKPHVNIAKTKSDLSLTANKILADFSSDENNANSIYLDKIVEVTGTISKIKVEKKKGIIALKTNDDFGSVLAHLSTNATLKINDFKEGEVITIKGICTGYLMDVIVVKCEIIN